MVQSKPVQKYITTAATDYLSRELQTKVSVGSILLKNLRTIEITHAYIADRHNDTLFYLEKTEASFKFFSNSRHFLAFTDVVLTNGLVNFREYAADSVYNYEFFFDFLSPDTPRDTTRAPVLWTIELGDVKLNNMAFSLQTEGAPVPPRKFNENDLRFNGITGYLDDFVIVDDSLSFFMKDVSFREKNSLDIRSLRADTRISSSGMVFDSLLLKTPYSTLGNNLRFSYTSWRDFNDFNNLVRMEGTFAQSLVSFKDIALFTDELEGWDQQLSVNGKVRGPLSNLKGREVRMQSGLQTFFEGDFDLKGLPDVDNTFMEFDVEKAQTNSFELASLIRLDEIPAEFSRLGNFRFKGNFTGFLNDFVAYGVFRTDLGEIRSDLNLKLPDGKAPAYSGSLDLHDFDLGTLTGQSAYLHSITLNSTIEGTGFTLNELDARFKADISQLGLADYNYSAIQVNGKLSRKVFEGALACNDPNLVFSFDGKVALDQEVPYYDFVSRIHYANLANLKLDKVPQSELSASLDIDFQGSDVNDITGSILINDLSLQRNNKQVQLSNIAITSLPQRGGNSLLTLQSDIADARISGNFTLTELPASFNNFLATLLPNTLNLKPEQLESQQFSFDVQLKRPKELIQVFSENAWIDEGTLTGSFNSATNSITLGLAVNTIHYDLFEANATRLDVQPKAGNVLHFDLRTDEVTYKDSSLLQDIAVGFQVDKQLVDFSVQLANAEARSRLKVGGEINFSDTGIYASLADSYLLVDSTRWKISPDTRLAIKDKEVHIQDFVLSNDSQRVHVSGIVNSDSADKLALDFNAFDLQVLNTFLFPRNEAKLAGVVNGNIDLFDLNNKIPLFVSRINADKLVFNGDTIGDVILHSTINTRLQVININGQVNSGLFENFSVSGFIKTNTTKDNLNLLVNLEPTKASVFEVFLEGLASDLEGDVHGKLRITGSVNEPEISGDVYLDQAAFTIDYLKTRYFFTTKVKVTKNRFDFGNFAIKDKNNSEGKAKGYISHTNFTDFGLNLRFYELKNFLFLNTVSGDNDQFYGTARVSGEALLTGTFDQLEIDIKARTEKGTAIFIPLENMTESGEVNFIHFVNEDAQLQNTAYTDLSGIQLNFDLQITPDAEIQLIFDSKLGDIITGRGTSDMRMEINTSGDFRMYGQYEIEEGKYLFTAASLINKNFVIKKGGTIVWNGDPLNARINLEAAYRTLAAPSNLVAGLVTPEELEAFKVRTPVLAKMYLSGQLMTPEIRFGIEFPDISSITIGNSGNANALINVVRRIQGDQEEMSRQVFSLLVANIFIRPSINQQYETNYQSSDVQAGLLSSSVGDLLSNQFSNWLSQIDSRWNLGVNYVFGNNTVNPSDLLISASNKFFNDRLELQGTFGANTTTGNFSATYRLTPDGRLRVRAFHRTGTFQNYDQAGLIQNRERNINTEGLGFFFRKEFDAISPERKRMRQIMDDYNNKNPKP